MPASPLPLILSHHADITEPELDRNILAVNVDHGDQPLRGHAADHRLEASEGTGLDLNYVVHARCRHTSNDASSATVLLVEGRTRSRTSRAANDKRHPCNHTDVMLGWVGCSWECQPWPASSRP